MRILICLNGTDENRFKRLWGLNQNPFPPIPKGEYGAVNKALNLLAAEPIPDTDYIRRVMSGIASDELIELMCKEFKKGEYVRFYVSFKEEK